MASETVTNTPVSIQTAPQPAQTRVRKFASSSYSRVKFESLECYARDDIPCGSGRCQHSTCSMRASPSIRGEISRYVFPTKEAVATYLDCFESEEFRESEGLVLLQSQVSRIERGKKRLLGRLRGLVRSNKRRSVVLFDDVHHAEVLNDCRGMGLREVAHWYEDHVGNGIECVVLDDDASVDAYFSKYWKDNEVMQNLYESQQERQQNADGKEWEARCIQNHRWNAADIDRGIEQGRLVKGYFEVDAQRSRDMAWVVVQGRRVAKIVGRKNRWHALHGDQVVAEMLVAVSAEDGVDPKVCADETGDEQTDNAEDFTGLAEQLVEDSNAETTADLTSAQIIHVSSARARPDIIVSIACEDVESIRRQDTSNKRSSVLCIPFDYRFPKMRLRSAYLDQYVDRRLLVRVIGWEDDSMYPNVHVIKAIGPAGDILTETRCILHRHGIDYEHFPAVALSDVPSASYRVEDEVESSLLHKERADFRSRFVVSIDPPGCTDVDDAFHVRVLDEETFELGIHIADVTHFLGQGTPLDEEAFFRGTTVYLVDRRLNMLPARISEDLASLLCERPRFAVSVVWKISRKTMAFIGDPWFGRSVIESRYQLAYANAQAILDGSSDLMSCGMKSSSDLAEMRTALTLVQSLAWNRLRTRLANGAIELDSQELRFDVDADGMPRSFHEKKTIDSMKIIAELMILANEAVATQLHRSFPSHALLRCHAAPDTKKLARMHEFCDAFCTAGSSSSGRKKVGEDEDKELFNQVHRFGADLQSIRHKIPSNALPLLQMTATRCLSEARYVRAASTPSTRHFGLAIDLYTHFTSPIRRYADIVVHRQLLASLTNTSPYSSTLRSPSSFSVSLQEHTVDTMNERNRASKLAQRECTLLYLLLFLAKWPQTEKAIVQSVAENNDIIVYVPRFELKGRIDTTNLGEAEVSSIKRFDTVWVRIEAHVSSFHGPKLALSLLQTEMDGLDAGRPATPKDKQLSMVAETHVSPAADASNLKSPTSPVDPMISLLQDLSLSTHHHTNPTPADLPPLPRHPPHRPKMPPVLTTAISNLLMKARLYQQRAIRAMNRNNQVRRDHWARLAAEASTNASTLVDYHYNYKSI